MIFGKDRRADCRLAKWHFGRVFRVAASGGPRPRTCEKGTGDSPRRRQGDGLPANLGINPRNQPAMLVLAQRIGFRLRRDPEDVSLMFAELSL
jgi:hypothetical protein